MTIDLDFNDKQIYDAVKTLGLTLKTENCLFGIFIPSCGLCPSDSNAILSLRVSPRYVDVNALYGKAPDTLIPAVLELCKRIKTIANNSLKENCI